LPDWLSETPPDQPVAEELIPDPPSATPDEVPIAQPVADPLGHPLFERIGIDPETERIVDWTRFNSWLEGQRQLCELRPPAESDPDPFHLARKQLAVWFDLKKNRDRLERADPAALRNDPALREFMSHFERYGLEKLARLWEYVDFLLENRRRSS
jgi:hypothetical protein